MQKLLAAQATIRKTIGLSMGAQKFIIVSNRLPVSVSKENGQLVYTRSAGGLATAMSSIEGERLWIGWPGIVADELSSAEKSAISRRLKKDGLLPVFLTQDQIDKFYGGYANDTIWPLFHYFQSFANYDNQYWEAYKEVNNTFKKAIITHAGPDVSIWIQDYHLMLLPRLLRQKLPTSTIGFFLHIPFPSFEIFRLLPNRVQVLEGLLGADLIGFHTYDYARHFLSSVLGTLGVESNHGSIVIDDRIVKVDAFPIGIDYQHFTQALTDEKTLQELKVLDDYYGKQKIILSMDRLDYSKGITKRLEAYEKFLLENPAYHKKIVLVMVAVPNRMEVETYKKLRNEVEKIVSRINGQYGSVDWAPISYQFQNLPFEQIIALQSRADIALVTPLRDGMNLVAKEYIAAKQQQLGVLILSEMAGAIDEMPEALRVNPNDIDAIASSIKQALAMPKKLQRDKLRSMQRRVSRYTVQRWAADFMKQLEESKLDQQMQGKKLLTTDGTQKLLRQFAKAKSRLFLLDYDGTLKGFTASYAPSQAKPSKFLRRLLKNLTALRGTKVCIISGRPRKTLDDWFKGIPVILAAEHGAWIRQDGEWIQQQVSMHGHKEKILSVLEQYAERTPGSSIEQKDFSLVWHYRSVPNELAQARNASLHYELSRLVAGTDLRVHKGSKIIEIKPRNVSKGAVTEEFMAMYSAEFLLCIGDDYTDEDMFRAAPENAYSIKVGLGATNARYQVPSIQTALKLLRTITDQP